MSTAGSVRIGWPGSLWGDLRVCRQETDINSGTSQTRTRTQCDKDEGGGGGRDFQNTEGTSTNLVPKKQQ